MKNELRQYADNYEAEVLAYENLESDEFIKQYINVNFNDDPDEGDVMLTEHFDALEIQFYKNEENNYGYYEICLTYGGPNVYLNVNTRWKSVEYHIGWGGDIYSKNISYLYDTIVQLYSLDSYL